MLNLKKTKGVLKIHQDSAVTDVLFDSHCIYTSDLNILQITVINIHRHTAESYDINA